MAKFLRYVLAGVLTLLVFSAFVFGALALACQPSRDEVARVTDPTGALDAVLVETNGGATTSFGYRAYVVARGRDFGRGERVARLYAAVRNESAYGANLRWAGPGDLRIEYLTARIADLEHPAVTVGGRAVRVRLEGGIVDSTAPGGGMLWNREGRPR